MRTVAARCPVRITRKFPAGLLAAVLLLATAPLAAQLPQARLYALFPAGGQAGTTVEVQLASGADLDEADTLLFTHPGITAVPKTQEVEGRQEPVANTFLVTIAADVPPGVYEARARGLYGITNPRSFEVGTREEIQEVEPNNTPEEATPLALGQVVNAQAGAATDIDWYKFEGTQGQRVIAVCRAARIDSRMSAALELHDANGRRLAFARGEARLRDDPLLDVTLPADGEYFLKVYDFVYGGGNEHVYRLAVGTGPHIDFLFPPAGLPGSEERYTLFGRNLPGGEPSGVMLDGKPLDKLEVTIPLPQEPNLVDIADPVDSFKASIDAVSYALESPAGWSNPVMLQLASAPVVTEEAPNDAPDQTQKITVPAEFVGQFEKRLDVDWIEFEAQAGEVYYLEAFGQRLGTTVDPRMSVFHVTRNEAGEETVQPLATVDSDPTNLAPNVFDTLTDDPVFRLEVPADGAYRVALRDLYYELRGDHSLVYRLSIRQEQPDFRLVVVPSTSPQPNQPNQPGQTWEIGLRRGDNVQVDVLAFRRDGFDGAIEVSAEQLPEGVTSAGAVIGPGQTRAPLLFSAAENAAEWAGFIRVTGSARVNDPETVRAVARAEAEVTSATEALPALDEALQKATEAAAAAKTQFDEAKQASDNNPDDENLKNRAAELERAYEEAEQARQAAEEARQAGQQRLTDAQAALAQAAEARDAAARDVLREARAGTIVWPQQGQQPPTARVARSIALSVLREEAPFQLTSDMNRVEAAQGEKVEIPVKLAKRGGFDENVALTVMGLPPTAKIQPENKPINKGADQETLALTVASDAPVGTYTAFVLGQAQVAYSRNPERAERLKAEHEEAQRLAAEAAEAAAKAAGARDAAVTKAAEDAEALAKAVADREAAEQQVQEADAAAKTAAEEKAKADKRAEEAAEAAQEAEAGHQAAVTNAGEEAKALEAAAAAKEAADKAAAAAKEAAGKLAEVQAVVEQATADAAKAAEESKNAETSRTPAEPETENEPDEALTAAEQAATQAADAAQAAEKIKAAVEQARTDADAAAEQAAAVLAAAEAARVAAEKASQAAVQEVQAAEAVLEDARAAAQVADQAKQEAEEKQKAAQEGLKTAQDNLAAAVKASEEAETALKASEEAKQKAETDAAAADEIAKALETKRQAAEKLANEAAEAAKPQNVNAFLPSTPIVIEVKPKPAE